MSQQNYLQLANKKELMEVELTTFLRNNQIFHLSFVTTNVEYHNPLLRMHRHHMILFHNNNLNVPNLYAFKRYAIHEIKITHANTIY